MTDHIHAVSAPFCNSIELEHQEWLASGEPCIFCGAVRKFNPPLDTLRRITAENVAKGGAIYEQREEDSR